MFLQTKRIFKTSYLHILRNYKLSIASILIMSLTFFVSSLFVSSLYGASIILDYFERQSQIIVFFNPDTVTQSYIQKIDDVIKNQGISVNVHFVSKEEAYKKFIEFLNQDSPTLSQSVNVNKLPPSLEIKTTNIDDLEKIASTLYQYQNQGNQIDKILYYKNVEDFLKEFIKIVRLSGLLFVSFLASISLLIVWITIGIAISTHTDEIEIMQLVGATRAYIEVPYVIEGAIYGTIGSLISVLLIAILVFVIARFYSSSFLVFVSYFKGIPVPTIGVGQILLIVFIELLLGAMVGSFGSFIAIRNKLR